MHGYNDTFDDAVSASSRLPVLYTAPMTSNAAPSIRRYAPADLDAVIDIYRRAIRETACRDYDPAQIAAWARVDREAWSRRRLDRPTWIALQGAEAAGFTDLEANGHLDMMFVHPDHQRRGVATALLETAEAAGRQAGLSRIFTEASITARPFFERRGFRVIAAQTVALRGQALANFRMEKFLA